MEHAAGVAAGRVFLFLQGPHGPFVRRLARRLLGLGASVQRICFNAADEAEWAGVGPFVRYLGPISAYDEWLTHHALTSGVTDIVLYGDTRPEHALAVATAWRLGLLCHCLEEGYLRPHHVTYERWGNNANSPLLDIPQERIARAVGPAGAPAEPAAEGWGAHRAHLWHSMLYHARLLLPARRYGRYRSRRDQSLWREFGNYLRRLAGLPLRRLAQRRLTMRLLASGRRYHLVLLQLSFDSSMRVHSDYTSSAEFVRECIATFASGAPDADLLVFKSHPFEDGRERLDRVIAQAAGQAGVADRVLFLDGGTRLAVLLDGATSVVTINSTAAQLALARGLPVSAQGRAVYARPGLTAGQKLAAFFAAPRRPDRQAYWQFRRFLTETSQLRGSFYSRGGIAALLEILPEALLSPVDPYERLLGAGAAGPPGVARLSALRPVPPEAPADIAREAPPPRRAAV